MSEDISILLIFLIIHWVIVFIPSILSGKWRSAIINFSIQVVYASYFIYGLISGNPSTALAYYFYFIFFIVIHAFVNSIQLFYAYSKNKTIRITDQVNIYDWVKFWGDYDQLIRTLTVEIDKNELTKIKISVDGTPKGWMIFRQSFQNWIVEHKQSLNENETNLIEKLLPELIVKTDLILKNAL